MTEEDIPNGISETTEPGAPLPGGTGITVAGYGEEIDLSQAKPADGPSLVPVGVHADGGLCYHGIDPASPETADGGRWRKCADGRQVLTHSPAGTPQLGQDGWELTPTPCPACGAADEVLVRKPHLEFDVPGDWALRPPGEQLAGATAYSWAWFCPVCGASGPGTPREKP